MLRNPEGAIALVVCPSPEFLLRGAQGSLRICISSRSWVADAVGDPSPESSHGHHRPSQPPSPLPGHMQDSRGFWCDTTQTLPRTTSREALCKYNHSFSPWSVPRVDCRLLLVGRGRRATATLRCLRAALEALEAGLAPAPRSSPLSFCSPRGNTLPPFCR